MVVGEWSAECGSVLLLWQCVAAVLEWLVSADVAACVAVLLLLCRGWDGRVCCRCLAAEVLCGCCCC